MHGHCGDAQPAKARRDRRGKRWGQPFQDKRDWKVYNKQLVGRGELLIHPTFFQRWSDDVKKANQGKEGAPFRYPDPLFQYLAFVRTRTKGLDYRTLEGFTRSLIEGMKPGLKIWGMTDEELARIQAPSFSQIRRRIVNLKLDPKDVSLLEKDEEVYLLLDATGVKVTNRNEWIRKHGGNRQSRGWLKLHIGIDHVHKQTQVLVTTTDRVGDVRKAPQLIHRGAKAIRDKGAQPTRGYGDGAYDSRDAHQSCKDEKVRPVLKIKAGASTKKQGKPERAKRVRDYQSLGYRDWAEFNRYGLHWLLEAKIGAVKRTTGEWVQSTTWQARSQEAKLKFWTHDAMLKHDHTGRAPWDRT